MNWQMGACRLHSAAFGSSWQVGALFRISARKDLGLQSPSIAPESVEDAVTAEISRQNSCETATVAPTTRSPDR